MPCRRYNPVIAARLEHDGEGHDITYYLCHVKDVENDDWICAWDGCNYKNPNVRTVMQHEYDVHGGEPNESQAKYYHPSRRKFHE